MSSIGLSNNHIIMRNYANPWYTHNYRLVDPSLDNETHTARRYHTLENTDFKYDLKFEISSDLTKELTYIEDYPNGMIIDDLKLRGKIKPFHEQTQPISVNPREQMKFCPTNFYNNGRYKGSEFAFEFKVKIIFSKIIRYRSWLDLRDHDLWELDRVSRVYPFKDPQLTIHKRDILPNKADRSHKEGTWYGSFFWPDYAGKDFKIPNEQLHRKDHYWVTEDEIDKVKSSEEILYEFFKDKYLVDYHYYMEKVDVSQVSNAFIHEHPYEDIPTWFGSTPNQPGKPYYWRYRPPDERIIDYNRIEQEGSGLITDLCWEYDRKNRHVIYYGLLTKRFVMLLIKDHSFESSIFIQDYLSKYSCFNHNKKPVIEYNKIKEIREKMGFGYTDEKDLKRWIKFRDTPR